jgi:hypothetical protein
MLLMHCWPLASLAVIPKLRSGVLEALDLTRIMFVTRDNQGNRYGVWVG